MVASMVANKVAKVKYMYNKALVHGRQGRQVKKNILLFLYRSL